MKYKYALLVILFQFSLATVAFTQATLPMDTIPIKDEQAFDIGQGKSLVYAKPKPFAFITQLPRATMGTVNATFSKKSIKPLAFIAVTTGLLILADEPIANGLQQFCRNIQVDPTEKNKIIWSIKLGSKPTTLIKAPQNINTALYQVGQGFPGLLLGAGMFAYGKINHNYRATRTASQLAETFILMGATTQVLKRITGRQSPQPGNENSNQWHFFPSFSAYQKNTPRYDAFPSGHLATLMSTVTILTENYPEKKWIKPVGYSVTGLVALSMINNGAHWASDYPLALGLGYLCARQVAKLNRQLVNKNTTAKNLNRLRVSIQYVNGHIMPACIYKL